MLNAQDLAAGLTGAVVKDPVHDQVIWREYLKRSSVTVTIGLTCTVPVVIWRKRKRLRQTAKTGRMPG